MSKLQNNNKQQNIKQQHKTIDKHTKHQEQHQNNEMQQKQYTIQ